MNPMGFALRHPILTLALGLALTCGGLLACKTMGLEIVPGMNIPGIEEILGSLGISSSSSHKEEGHEEQNKIVVTSPQSKYVNLTQQYVCQIHAQRQINVRALQDGYLQEIRIKEGQPVKQGEVLFRINPTLYEARYEAELAEARLAQIEFDNTKKLYEDKVVSVQEVLLREAKLKKAKAQAQLAKRELDFCTLKAPFDGIVDKLHDREGSLIKERDILTTMSDNSVMWVYFNVPERRYLEYVVAENQGQEDPIVELVLATGNKFSKPGKLNTVEAKFNNETGNIAFRADFENEYVQVNGNRLPMLRHGQTGNVLIHRTLKNAIVIPQRAVFEIMDKRYVWIVDKENVVHQHEIVVQNELEDIFVISRKDLDVKDRIVFEGVRQVHDGEKVECEFRPPEEIVANQKYHAE